MNMPTGDCERARRALSADLDAQATESEIGSALRHVRGCPACASFAQTVAELVERLRSAEALEPTRQLAPARVRVHARRRVMVRRSLAAAGLAASLAAAALLGAAVSAHNQPPAPGRSSRPPLLLASARDESALRTLELSRYAPSLNLGRTHGGRPMGGVFEASDLG